MSVNLERGCHFETVYGDEGSACNAVSKRLFGRYDGRSFVYRADGTNATAERLMTALAATCGRHAGRLAEEMGAEWSSRLTEYREYLRKSTEKQATAAE